MAYNRVDGILPSAFVGLSQLTALSLVGNSLQGLPSSVAGLDKLAYVSNDSNSHPTMPNSMFALSFSCYQFVNQPHEPHTHVTAVENCCARHKHYPRRFPGPDPTYVQGPGCDQQPN